MTRHTPVSQWQQLSDDEFDCLRVNGTKINYYVICPRKLWLFSKGLTMERSADRVALGRLLHREAYRNISRRELLIDNLIRIDVIQNENKVLEVKSSQKFSDAARMQLAYYLLYLKHLGSGELMGELRYPKNRRREEVQLTPDLEAKVTEILRAVHEIERQSHPPNAPLKPFCRNCAYAELCWG